MEQSDIDVIVQQLAHERTRAAFLKDATERVVSSFVQGFGGTAFALVVTKWADIINAVHRVDTINTIGIAAIGAGATAALSALKVTIARFRGDPASASLTK